MGKSGQGASPALLATHPVRALRADGHLVVAAAEEVPAEHVLSVLVDGRPLMRLVCTATNLEELVVGRLFSEGVIASIDEIESLTLNEELTEARVETAGTPRALRAKPVEFVPSAATGSRVFAEVRDRAKPAGKVAPIPWEPDDIFALARVFAADSPMHRSTFGVHSCYLALGSDIQCRCEDLGRHNAFDKVIGHGLMHRIDLSQCTVFSSGRLPVDMIAKAIQTGIPIVASKAVTTDHAIKLACESDLTLICSAWPDSMRVYNDPAHCAHAGARARTRAICA